MQARVLWDAKYTVGGFCWDFTTRGCKSIPLIIRSQLSNYLSNGPGPGPRKDNTS